MLFSASSAISEALKESDVYYHSSLFCPKEKPIRKVQIGASDTCDVAFFSVDDDYFHWNGQKICKIPPDQLEEQIKIQAKIKELEDSFSKDYSEKVRVSMVLLNISEERNYPYGCFSEMSIHPHDVNSTKYFPHDGNCTEDELQQLNRETMNTIGYNEMIEKVQMEKYGKDCFSCDADVEFLTDKETCDICPNREMDGNLCVLRKDVK